MALLDSFPGAAAAFSLRKLRGAYAGSAVRVRRTSDNAEQDIGFSGNDLDSSSLTSFCGSGSAYVTKWYDQSGNGNDVLQVVALQQPRLVSSGTIDTDSSGLPTVVFDGTDDYLASATITTLTQANTYFAVATLSDATTGTKNLIDGDLARNLIQQSGTSYGLFAGTAITGGTVDTDQHVWTALFDGASSLLRIDSTSVITGNPGAGGLDMVVVGASSDGSNPWIGYVSEVVVYNGDRSADFARIELNLTYRDVSVNTSSMWRGAVEPLETGSTGNTSYLWRGAVEPAYVAAASSKSTGPGLSFGMMGRLGS